MQSLIENILKKKSIVEYLEKRDIRPIKRLSGGKLSYLCPLPDHKESKPSFIVYTNDEYENFYCFGCNRGTTIIQLVAAIEQITVKKAINILSEGAEITDEMEIELSENKMYREHTSEEYINLFGNLSTLRILSEICQVYLQNVNYEGHEVKIIDNFWERVDQWILDYDFEQLKDLYVYLPGILRYRRDKYEIFKKEKTVQEFAMVKKDSHNRKN